MNKNIILTVFLLAVAVLIVIVVAAVMSRSERAIDLVPATIPSENRQQQTDKFSAASPETDRSKSKTAVASGCGDGVCSNAESARTCTVDCANYDVFGGFRFKDLSGGGHDISWTTSIPLSSAVDYGLTKEYELGTVSEEQLKTDHNLRITSVSGDELIYLRFRGRDEAGNEQQFIGLYITPFNAREAQ